MARAFTEISSWRSAPLSEVDPITGVQKIFHRHHDGEWTVEARQDVEPIAEANKQARNHLDPRTADQHDKAMLVARIPAVFWDKFAIDYGVDIFNPDHDEAVNRLLDGEYRWMKTTDMQLAKRHVSKAQIERRLAMRKLFEAA